MKTQYLVGITVLAFGFSCGVDDNSTPDVLTESQGTTTTEEVSNDSTVASEDISAQTESGLNSVVNLDVSTSTSLAFSLVGDDTESEERDCTVAADGTVEVNILRSRDRNITKTKGEASIVINGSRSATITRTWAKTGTTLACNTELTHIDIKPEDLATTTLTTSFSREASQFMEITKGEETKTKNRSKTSTGTRNITFNASAEADGVVTINKNVVMDITTEFTRLDKDGVSKTVNTNIKTDTDAPLVVEVTRSKSDRGWLTRKIISGKTIGTNGDGGRVELVYTNALFTKDGECTPTSGTLEGSIFTSAEGEATKTFTVDFSTTIKTITFSDGSTEEMEITDCGFSKAKSATVKKVKKANQSSKKKIQRKSSKES